MVAIGTFNSNTNESFVYNANGGYKNKSNSVNFVPCLDKCLKLVNFQNHSLKYLNQSNSH